MDLSHARDVKAETHVPENNSNVGVAFPNLLLPFEMLDNVIVVVEFIAWKVYHTSSSGVPPQVAFAVTPEFVALDKVPFVAVVHVLTKDVRTVAPPQLSLDGWAKLITV